MKILFHLLTLFVLLPEATKAQENIYGKYEKNYR